MKVNILWGSEKIEMECNIDEPIENFMKLLEKRTGVLVSRQRLLMRKKQIKITDKWSQFDLKPETRIMLIGTAEKAPVIVDMPEVEDKDEVDDEDEIPSYVTKGLKNLGNTCYLNSVLQVFRFILEIPSILKSVDPTTVKPGEEQKQVARQLSIFLNNYPNNLADLVDIIRESNPDFEKRDQNNNFIQQDASECWGYLMKCISRYAGNKISDLFHIQFETKTKPLGSEEQPVIGVEDDDRLRCFIDQDTKQIEQGIKFDSEIEKINPSTKETVVCSVSKLIKRLPKYLTIQMMRFCFKKEENGTAKIVRRVEHPFRLDVLQWLTPELRATFVKNREAHKDENAGYYDLKAIITHQGRSPDSGHYICFVKYSDQWFKFDDEKVQDVDDESVQAVNGGGDWHCSYILVYEAV